MRVKNNLTGWPSTATDKDLTRSSVGHYFGGKVERCTNDQLAVDNKIATSFGDPISAFIAAAYYFRKTPDRARINQ
jgi:hypothetical protein